MSNPNTSQQVNIEFMLKDLREVQFKVVELDFMDQNLHVNNQIRFDCHTQERLVRCVTSFEFKSQDITCMLLTVESVLLFTRESWSEMYDLRGDEWTVPAPLAGMLAQMTVNAARGILSVRTEEKLGRRMMLPLVDPAASINHPLRFPRLPQAEQPSQPGVSPIPGGPVARG